MPKSRLMKLVDATILAKNLVTDYFDNREDAKPIALGYNKLARLSPSEHQDAIFDMKNAFVSFHKRNMPKHAISVLEDTAEYLNGVNEIESLASFYKVN